MKKIFLLCRQCGNAVITARLPYDPREAVRVESASCNLCDDGGYDMQFYFRSNGTEVLPPC
jgi:hypothetical protein